MKIIVGGLNLKNFYEEIYSQSIMTLVDNMAQIRHKLSGYRGIIEISKRIKRLEVKRV